MVDFSNFNNFIGKIEGLEKITAGMLGNSIIFAAFWLFLVIILVPEEYGKLSYLYAVATIAGVISSLGFNQVLLVLPAKGENIQATVYWLGLIASFIVSIISYVIFNNVSVSLFIIGFAIFNLVYHESLGSKKYNYFIKIAIIQKILLVVFSLGLYYLIGIDGIILGMFFSFLLPLKQFFCIIKEQKIQKEKIKKHFNFFAASYAFDLTKNFTMYLDKIIILPLLGYIILGNYQFSLHVILFIIIIPTAVLAYSVPKEAINESTNKLKIITVVFTVILVTISILFSPILIPILLPEYVESIPILQIMVLGAIPLAGSHMLISKFLALEKIIPIIIGSILFITFQISLIYLLVSWETIGLSIAFVVASSIEFLFLFIVQKTSINIFSKK